MCTYDCYRVHGVDDGEEQNVIRFTLFLSFSARLLADDVAAGVVALQQNKKTLGLFNVGHKNICNM